MAKICSVEGCGRTDIWAHGYCGKHYKRWYRYGDPLKMAPKKKYPTRCIVEGCSGSPVGRGYCRKHYNRWYAHGSVGTTQTPIGVAKSNPAEYTTWQGIKNRCYNIHEKSYPNYGGRGIKICDRWLGPYGFVHFLEDMGPRPEGMSIDRIDNDGGYCPENCRWADRKTQSNNRRNVIQITIDGETHSLAEWCRIKGVSEWAIRSRLRSGWGKEELFKRPIREMHYNN